MFKCANESLMNKCQRIYFAWCEIVTLIFLFVSPQAGNYDESIRHLEFLQELNKDDFKISMNKAIVEFYKSGQTAIGNLKQSLMATIKSQVIVCRIPHLHSHSHVLLDLSVAFILSSFFHFKFTFISRCTCQQKTLTAWTMLKTAYCTTIKPLFTTTCVSIRRPSSSERDCTSSWNRLVRFQVFMKLNFFCKQTPETILEWAVMNVWWAVIVLSLNMTWCHWFFLFVFPPRREVCSGCLLSAGGSLPAHLPTGESPSPSSCTGQAVSARKQQEQQRRGTTRSLRRIYVCTKSCFICLYLICTRD